MPLGPVACFERSSSDCTWSRAGVSDESGRRRPQTRPVNAAKIHAVKNSGSFGDVPSSDGGLRPKNEESALGQNPRTSPRLLRGRGVLLPGIPSPPIAGWRPSLRESRSAMGVQTGSPGLANLSAKLLTSSSRGRVSGASPYFVTP